MTNHIMSTETVAPKTSALCQPKDIFLDFGLAAIQMENKEMAKEAMSVRRCAASVAMAKELLSTPPTTSAVMKKVQRQIALSSLKTALNQEDNVSSQKEFHTMHLLFINCVLFRGLVALRHVGPPSLHDCPVLVAGDNSAPEKKTFDEKGHPLFRVSPKMHSSVQN